MAIRSELNESPAAGARPICEHMVVALLGIAAVVAPVCLGASGPFARLALEGVMAGSVCLWALADKRPPHLAILPLIAAAAILLQLVPLPDNLLLTIAPVSAGTWKFATAGLEPGWRSVSVDPGASLVAMRRLILAVATVCAVADLTRYRSHRSRLIGALATSGAVIIALGFFFGKADVHERVVLGLIRLAGPIHDHINPTIFPVQSAGAAWPEQIVVGNSRYVADSGSVGDGFGSYIYSNHFAGGAILTVPVLLAASLYLAYRRLPAMVAYAATAVAAVAVGWLIGVRADSRGGLACFGMVALTLVALVPEQRWARKAGAAFALAYAALLSLFVGLLVAGGDPSWIAGWFPASLRPQVISLLTDTRAIPARVAMRMFFASPVLGTGLDTYSDIFPRFYNSNFSLFYAHNDFAQWLAETGLCGGTLAAVLLLPVFPRGLRFWRDAPLPYRLLSAGPWAALAGLAVHSAFDWNLHLPANAFLACLVLGLCLASVPASKSPVTRWAALLPQGFTQACFVVICATAFAFLVRDALSASAQRFAMQAIVADRLHRGSAKAAPAEQLLEAAIRSTTRVAGADPRNASLAVTIGHLQLHAATYADDPGRREALTADADHWFRRARARCAVCRGLPEPMDPRAGAGR